MDPLKPQRKQVELYEMMVGLLKAEETCKEHARESEEEVRAAMTRSNSGGGGGGGNTVLNILDLWNLSTSWYY